ncbi:MAG: efflux RND transporter periplasmic adaptor subunit [Planctomycetota bacterium]|nr:efflux RND transporter periplasmic adaptor subunit [Planctomycetota bacterium]
MRRQRILLAVAFVAVGLAVGFLLPRAWVFVDGDQDTRAGHDHGDADAQYACPMFCVLMQELPDDKKCPVCGMTMTKVSGESALSPAERRMIGLEIGAIRRLRLTRTVRVVGEADFDETRLSKVTTRVAGWLERVWADTTWMPVTEGQKLAEIYAPALYAAQKEYLIAWRAAEREGSGAGDKTMLESARRRLRLYGIGAEEIDALRRTGKVRDSMILRAPRAGVLAERHAVVGSATKKGATLYAIADLSTVWIQAEVFEHDLPLVRPGQEARMRTDSGSEEFVGKVAFVDPIVNRTTRTARVRIEVRNPERPDGMRRLRIGQRVDVWIDAEIDAEGRPLAAGAQASPPPFAVPRSAVLSTGNRRVIYLLFTESMGKRDYALDPDDLPETVFYELVPVRVGPLGRRVGDPGGAEYYPLLAIARSAADPPAAGALEEVREGVAVAVTGNLLIDSQAQLSGKPSLLFPKGNRGRTGDPHAGH